MPTWMIILAIAAIAVMMLFFLCMAIVAKRADRQAELDYQILLAEEELARARGLREIPEATEDWFRKAQLRKPQQMNNFKPTANDGEKP